MIALLIDRISAINQNTGKLHFNDRLCINSDCYSKQLVKGGKGDLFYYSTCGLLWLDSQAKIRKTVGPPGSM